VLSRLLAASSALLLGAGRVLGADFPPFLPDAERLPAEVRSEVVSVWSRHTLSRTVSGQPARVPLDLFRLFVDLPEVTTAAARHLGLAKYRVRQLGLDLYGADDGEGAMGTYRVLVREPHRRIMLTWGRHTSFVLGEISGASLTLLAFEPETDADGRPWVAQRVETFVRIDNRVAAFFARLLLPLFSGYADRKIVETFNVTARVSEWAREDPADFCRWLAGEPEAGRHRAAFAPLLPPCGVPA